MYPGTWAESTPDKDAIVMGGGQRVTYRELDDRSMQLAQLLHARGLRPGDHIAIFAENHPRYYEVYWAAMRSGLYLTAVNRHLKDDEVAYLVNDSESRCSSRPPPWRMSRTTSSIRSARARSG